MLITGTLLLAIFTVTGINSQQQDYLSDTGNNSPQLSRAYRYNHPPLFEEYEAPDPDELEVRKVREVTDITDVPATKTPSRIKKIKRGNSLRRTRYEESFSPDNIPVTVIHEKPSTQSSNKKVKVKRRKLSIQAQPSNEESKPEINAETKKITPESTTEVTKNNANTPPVPRTVVPKVFTKRPPQFNPVFKKIRQHDPVIRIVDEKNFVYAHKGNFHFSFEGADGTKVSSQGELRSFDDDKAGEAVVGSVFYKDNDGNDVSLTYTADEHGYRPHGAHLPTPPPIPPAIARALKYLETATSPEPVTEPIKKN